MDEKPVFALKPAYLGAAAVGLALWAAIIFLPHWNPHAIFYVILCAIIVACYVVGSEILWHKRHPRLSRKMTQLEIEQDKREGRD